MNYLFFVLASFLLVVQASSSRLVNPGCRMVKMEGKYFATKDEREKMETEKVIETVASTTTFDKCKLECHGDCKAVAMHESRENEGKGFDGCLVFTDDVQGLLESRKVLLWSEGVKDEDNDEIWTIYSRICDEETKIGGSGNGAVMTAATAVSSVASLAFTLLIL